MFHITDIQKYLHCSQLYANSLHKTKKDEIIIPHIQMSETLSILASKKLKIQDAFFGKTGDACEKSLEAMKEYEWLIKARFEYHDLRVQVPFLHHREGIWDIYFAKNELYPREDSAQYMADTIWVLKQLNIPLGNYYSIHFNHDYVRKKELDYDALLLISDYFYNQKNHPTKRIQDVVEKKIRDLDPILDDLRNFDEKNIIKKRNTRCTRRYRCNYYYDCWTEEKELPDSSILYLISSEHKYDMYKNGIVHLKDANPDLIEGTRQQYAQIMADKNGGLFVDVAHLRAWVKDKCHFPLSFIDFEWDCYGVPPYEGMHPFDVSLFQYSLHILDSEDAPLRHEEFIGLEDCRKQLLEDLLNKLPEEGSVIAFNSIGAEEIRLKELSELYPEYKEKIENILSRMVDFSTPFTLGMIYDIRMKGLYSLKQIVEVAEVHTTYKTLDISQAMSAVYHWRQLEELEDKEKEQQIIQDLLAYCSMDTYSLYLLYLWFIELMK